MHKHMTSTGSTQGVANSCNANYQSSPLLPSAELLLMVTAPLLVFRGPVCLLYASFHLNQRVKNGGIDQPSCGNETTNKGRAQHGLTNNHSHSTEQNIVFCLII